MKRGRLGLTSETASFYIAESLVFLGTIDMRAFTEKDLC